MAKNPQEIAEAIGKMVVERDMAGRKLGMQLVSVAPGRCVLRMTVQPDMVNSHGTCHGGVIFTLADSAFGYACNSFNRNAVAQQCDITYLKPVAVGTVLTATAELREAAGRSSVYDMTVQDEDGNTVALFRGLSREIGGAIIAGLED